jgi:cytochrome P450
VQATPALTSGLPPGPPPRFLGGNLAEFQRDRLAFLTRCARDYGDFVSLRMGRRRLVLVSEPAAIEYVLVSGSRNFIKHFALRINPLVLGKGLLTSEGDFWLRQRRLAQPAFLRQRVAAYAPIMLEYTHRLLAAWEPGETRNILADMMRLTLGIAAKTLFDADVDDRARDVGAALEVAQQAFIARFGSLLLVPAWVPTPTNRRLRQAVRRLDAIIYGFIRQRRASAEDNGDLLSLLLHARDDNNQPGMTDQQLRDEAMTLFLAGHETTALVLTWSWYLLARHPEAAARLSEEVLSVLDGRDPAVADLPRLRYTEWVVQEAMRLYPPGYTLGREAIADCHLGGYHIPAGCTLFMSPWVMHRDPRFFAEPEAFRPERWDNDLLGRLPRIVYFPFGAGPRRCIGDSFALMEVTLILATLAQRFRFTLATEEPILPRPTFTLRPASPVRAVLRRR